MPRGGTDRSRTKPVNSTIKLHKNDLPAGVSFTGSVAIDTETLGLKPHRDRLCLVQLSGGDDSAHLVQLDGKDWSAPRLKALLADPDVLKIFHFGRFDIAMLAQHLGVVTGPVYCTKIASKLARTYTDRHGLKDLCAELLGVDLSKQQQSSDWGADKLTDQQIALRRLRRALPARAQGQARRHARARGPHGRRPGLLPLPARPRQARPRGLRGRGHLRALTRQWAAGAECRRPIKSRSAARMSATPC